MLRNFRGKSSSILLSDCTGLELRLQKIIGKNEFAGQLTATILPDEVKLAKVLGTLGAASLAVAAFQKPEEAVLLYATDNTSINTHVERLIHDCGFEPVS